MSDWGKVISVFMQGKPAMILAIFVAILAFAPIDSLAEIKQKYEVWVNVAGVLAAASIAGNFLYWLKDIVSAKMDAQRKKEETEAKAIEDQNREVEAFDSLSDDLRAFLCDLYFTGKMSREVPLDDPGIQTLLSQGFVSYARAGMVSAHPRYGRAVMVTLSKRSLRLFKNNESAMRRVYIGLVGLIS